MPFIPYIYILHCLAIAHNSSVFLPIGNSGDYYLEIMTLMHFIMIPIFSGKMGMAAKESGASSTDQKVGH